MCVTCCIAGVDLSTVCSLEHGGAIALKLDDIEWRGYWTVRFAPSNRNRDFLSFFFIFIFDCQWFMFSNRNRQLNQCFLLYLIYFDRWTRCHPEKDVHQMGQQTSAKGKDTDSLVDLSNTMKSDGTHVKKETTGKKESIPFKTATATKKRKKVMNRWPFVAGCHRLVPFIWPTWIEFLEKWESEGRFQILWWSILAWKKHTFFFL